MPIRKKSGNLSYAPRKKQNSIKKINYSTFKYEKDKAKQENEM